MQDVFPPSLSQLQSLCRELFCQTLPSSNDDNVDAEERGDGDDGGESGRGSLFEQVIHGPEGALLFLNSARHMFADQHPSSLLLLSSLVRRVSRPPTSRPSKDDLVGGGGVAPMETDAAPALAKTEDGLSLLGRTHRPPKRRHLQQQEIDKTAASTPRRRVYRRTPGFYEVFPPPSSSSGEHVWNCPLLLLYEHVPSGGRRRISSTARDADKEIGPSGDGDHGNDDQGAALARQKRLAAIIDAPDMYFAVLCGLSDVQVTTAPHPLDGTRERVSARYCLVFGGPTSGLPRNADGLPVWIDSHIPFTTRQFMMLCWACIQPRHPESYFPNPTAPLNGKFTKRGKPNERFDQKERGFEGASNWRILTADAVHLCSAAGGCDVCASLVEQPVLNTRPLGREGAQPLRAASGRGGRGRRGRGKGRSSSSSSAGEVDDTTHEYVLFGDLIPLRTVLHSGVRWTCPLLDPYEKEARARLPASVKPRKSSMGPDVFFDLTLQQMWAFLRDEQTRALLVHCCKQFQIDLRQFEFADDGVGLPAADHTNDAMSRSQQSTAGRKRSSGAADEEFHCLDERPSKLRRLA